MLARIGSRLETVHRRIDLKVIFPDGRKVRLVNRAGAGRGFNADNIDRILESFAEDLERKFPHWEFHLMPIGPNAFNFIYAGLREQPATNKGESLP